MVFLGQKVSINVRLLFYPTRPSIIIGRMVQSPLYLVYGKRFYSNGNYTNPQHCTSLLYLLFTKSVRVFFRCWRGYTYRRLRDNSKEKQRSQDVHKTIRTVGCSKYSDVKDFLRNKTLEKHVKLVVIEDSEINHMNDHLSQYILILLVFIYALKINFHRIEYGHSMCG